ncbi:MAG: alpha/beta fold hydrolase [Acidimicrobiia bacterium]
MPRVVFIPGFTQTAASWRPVVAEMIDEWDLVVADIPDGLSFVDTATALAQQHGAAFYIGYSMGARLALQLALDHPEVVQGLVLTSGTPGLADANDRAARAASDYALAERIETIGADAFIAEWLTQPMFATLPDDPEDRAARAAQPAARLAHQLRALGQGTMEPLWDRLGELNMPVLLAVGGTDEKYATVAREMMRSLGPNADAAVLDSGGHAVHVEHPFAFAILLLEFVISSMRAAGQESEPSDGTSGDVTTSD